MFSFCDKPRSALGILSDSKNLFTASFSKVWLWIVLFNFPMILVGGLIGKDPVNSTAMYFYITFSVYLVAVLFAVSGIIFFYNHIYSIGDGGEETIGLSLRLMFKKIIPVLANFVAIVLVLVLAVIPFLFAFVVIFSSSIGPEFNYIPLLIGMGVFFLLVMNFFWLCMLFIMFENAGIFRAIKLSFVHVYGKYWRTLIMVGVLMSVSFAFMFGLIAPLQNYLTAAGVDFSMQVIILSTLQVVFNVFYMPFASAFLLVTYRDLKVRRALKLKLKEANV